MIFSRRIFSLFVTIGKINAIADLLPEMPWVREAPVFLIFLANGRRLPKISEMRGEAPFQMTISICCSTRRSMPASS